MSAFIQQAFVDQFESYVHHLGQQQMSRLMNTVRVKRAPGRYFHFERLAKADMIARGGSAGAPLATPVLDVVHSKRVAGVDPYSWGEIVNPHEAAQTLTDPRSEYVKSAAMAWGRRVDTTILTASIGSAAVGIGAGGSPAALPAGQQIGSATAAMTLTLLREAKRKLDEAEVGGPGSTRYAVINAAALDQLLRVTEIGSYDYNSVKALVQGEIDTFMGFKFIRTELIPQVAGQPTRKYCVFYDESAIGLFIPQERFARVAEDPANSFATRVYLEMLLGAVRIEDAGVVRCEILTTA